MEETSKSPSPSHEAAFRRYYNDLFREVHRPVRLAELLFSDGVIQSDIKDSITSDEDEDQKRALLDAVQYALANSTDPEQTMRTVCTALGKSGVHGYYTDKLSSFVPGEYYFV